MTKIINVEDQDLQEYKEYYRNTVVGAKGKKKKEKNIKPNSMELKMDTNISKEDEKTMQNIMSNVETAKNTTLDTFGVLNMPHQYTGLADPTAYYSDGTFYGDVIIDDNDSQWMGRTYQKYVGSLGPYCIFKVGKPKYNGVFGQVSNDVISEMMEMDDESKGNFIDTLFEGSKENEMYYYTFQDAFDEYCQYVNTLVVYTGSRMGIPTLFSKGLTLSSFDASKYIIKNNSNGILDRILGDMLYTNNYLTYYLDSAGTSAGESSGNSTTDSQLAGALKTLGQSKRELDFLLGKTTDADSSSSSGNAKNIITELYSGIEGIADKLTNKLSGSFSSISMGANLLFPQIWNESEYSFSYSLKIRLESPYGDKESIFRNVYIPFFYLMAMALPRQSGKQGYVGPFLVQACAKGWFGCYCGIIGNFQVTKAPNSEWNYEGYPTALEVSFDLKDMYPTMVGISKGTGVAFRQNYTLVSYLNVMAGVKCSDFDPGSLLKADVDSIFRDIVNTPYMLERKITGTVGRPVRSLITKIFGGYN